MICKPERTPERSGFRSLIDKAASTAGAEPTEWARHALADALRAAGIHPTPKASRLARCTAMEAPTNRLVTATAATLWITELAERQRNIARVIEQLG